MFAPGYGFDAIGIAILSKGNPIAVLIFALVFGGVRAGVTLMQRVEGVPSAIGQVLIALPVLFLAADAARKQYSQKKGHHG
jgi:general nucleoside transport system permease protein